MYLAPDLTFVWVSGHGEAAKQGGAPMAERTVRNGSLFSPENASILTERLDSLMHGSTRIQSYSLDPLELYLHKDSSSSSSSSISKFNVALSLHGHTCTSTRVMHA